MAERQIKRQSLAEFKKNPESGSFLCKGYTAGVTAPDTKGFEDDADLARTLNFVISTGEVDRDNDTVNPEGFTNLKTFHKTGVNLWAHDPSLPPIGKPGKVYVEDGKVKSSITFLPPGMDHPLGNNIGETLRQMFLQGYMKSVSIGFSSNEFAFSEERGGMAIDFKKQELLEFSPVPIPSNRGAMVQLAAKGFDLRPLHGWAEKCLDGGATLLVPRSDIEEAHKDLKAAVGETERLITYGRKVAEAIRNISQEEKAGGVDAKAIDGVGADADNETQGDNRDPSKADTVAHDRKGLDDGEGSGCETEAAGDPPELTLDDVLDCAIAFVKSGRVLSSTNEKKIREAVELLSLVLSKLDTQDEDEGKKSVEEPGKPEVEEPKTTDEDLFEVDQEILDLLPSLVSDAVRSDL